MPLLFIDYTKLVIKYYDDKRKAATLSTLLIDPTTAGLRQACINTYKERIARGDRKEDHLITDVIGVPPAGEDFCEFIFSTPPDIFKPLRNFIKGGVKNPLPKTVELLAWLIDYPHRPLARAQSEIQDPDLTGINDEPEMPLPAKEQEKKNENNEADKTKEKDAAEAYTREVTDNTVIIDGEVETQTSSEEKLKEKNTDPVGTEGMPEKPVIIEEGEGTDESGTDEEPEGAGEPGSTQKAKTDTRIAYGNGTSTVKHGFIRSLFERIKTNWKKIVLTGSTVVVLLFGGLFVGQNQKVREIFGDSNNKCMYWAEDHYEKIACDEKPNGKNIVPLDKDRLENFKKITDLNSITEESIGKIYYLKTDNMLEYFTAPGPHPVSTNRYVGRLTRNMYEKYTLKEKRAADSLLKINPTLLNR